MTQEPETPASEQLRTREAQLRDWAARVVLEQKLVDGESGELGFSMVSGDASFRRYFRIGSGSKTFIAVDAPPTHEDSARFIHVDELFSKAGVHVPKVFASDLQHGFMLLEDFSKLPKKVVVRNLLPCGSPSGRRSSPLFLTMRRC